mmetsp:Transcript_31795/g.75507  ORF Transcript_31795/g.75507 Transcript_31795/m.75507 type:complete len:200 (+) Transcript_31795:698-1297(+)
MARRQPRKPSIGFTSASFVMVSSTASSLTPVSAASEAVTSSISPAGRNSCSGGSSRRMVTGRPSIARKMPSKSSCWKGSSWSRAFWRSSVVCARIIRRTVVMRSSLAKNMCSVRVRPIPSAPLRRAAAASSGVSALVSTPRRRNWSTHDMNVARSPDMSATLSGCLPAIISPVLPLSETQSPSWMVNPPTVAVLASSST